MKDGASQTPVASDAPSPGRRILSDVVDLRLAVVGVVGGVLSGLLGVGGGVVMVPLLVVWAGFRQREAHALSLGAIIPISLAGIVTYSAAGRVRIVDALALAAGSVFGARLGAGLLARIEERLLKGLFGVFLVAVSLTMAVRP